MSEPKKIVILYSGGLDSLIMDTLAKHEGHEITRVFFNIGQPNLEKELRALEISTNAGRDVRRRNVDWLGLANGPMGKAGSASGNIYIPGRNLVLASLAACIYLPDEIWLGALHGETHAGATDKNYPFRNHATDILSYTLSPFKSDGVKLVYPLAERGWNKLDAARWALTEGGLSPKDLTDSSSCLNAGEHWRKCGECVVCLRRWGLFTILGKELNVSFDETFDHHPLTCPDNRVALRQMLTGDYYDEARMAEVVPALPIYAEQCAVSVEWLITSMLGASLPELNDGARRMLGLMEKAA